MLPSREVSAFTAFATKRVARPLPSAAFPLHRLRRVGYLLLAASLLLLGLSATLPVHAQTAIFMGDLQLIGGQSEITGTAVDAKGDVWLSAFSGVFELQAVNGVVPPGSSTQEVAHGSFTLPTGIAVDAAGDVFVSDSGATALYEIEAVGGSIPASPTVITINVPGGLSFPRGIAFDSKGNLWLASQGGSSVIELNAVSGSIPASPTIVTYTGVSSSGNGGAGFNSPFGVAIDSSGDVFVADTKNNQIKEMIAVAGSVPAPTASAPAINILGSGFNYPEGVAIDSWGDVFVADSLNSQLKEMLASGGSVPLSSPQIIIFASTNNLGNTQYVSSVAIDAYNDVFFTGNGEVNELAQAANFGQLTVGVGSESDPTTAQDPYQFLLFGFASQGSIKAPAVYTQGATGQDFTDHLTGTCTTNGTSYVYGNGTNDDTCTVIAKFTPRYPGRRLGAVQLSASGGGVIATAPLLGTGLAPMINFGIVKTGNYYPTSSTSFSFNAGTNVAVDPNHNLYVACCNGIFESTAASSYSTETMVAPANSPNSVSLDGAGDLIWVDYGSGQVLEAVAVNGVIPANPTPVPLGSGWSVPWSSVIDGQGDVFVASSGQQAIYEIVAAHGVVSSTSTVKLIENTYPALWMAFDQSGNLYFTSAYQHACIEEIPAVGGQILPSTPIQQVYCSFSLPLSIAVDAAGNLWEADFYSGVSKVEAVNGVIPASPTVIDFNTYAFGLGLDANGNVFWTTYLNGNNNTLYEYDFADPPTFTWSGTTDVGQTNSTVNTAFATNAGNEPLQVVVPFSGSNPAINSNWTWNTSATGGCPSVSSGLPGTDAANIAPGALCVLPISFAPQNGGSLTGQLTFTDDNLYVVENIGNVNPNDATQNITLNGNASGLPAPTVNWGPLAGVNYGTALPSSIFNATFTTLSTNLTNDGTITYYVSSVGGAVATTSTILPAGSDTLCVQWVPGGEYSGSYSSASLCLPITVSVASTSISWTPVSPISLGAALGSGQLNATASSGSTPVSSDGTFTYYLSVVGGTVANSSTVLPAGSNTVCVQWSPSSSYLADYNSSQACATVQVNAGPTINWAPTMSITYGAALGSGDFTATAFSGTTNISADGAFAYYVGTVGGTTATASTILPGGSDQLCVQWMPSSSYALQYSSASECVPITVNAASTSISWSPSSSTIIASSGPTAGQFDAMALTGSSSNATGNGTVTYHLSTVGGTVIAAGASLSPGPVTICAVWAPSSGFAADYTGSNTCQSFTVINTQPTTTSVATNASPIFLTTSVTFTATVTPTSGTIVPTGTVTFLDNGVSIGTGTLSTSGSGASATAKLTTSSLAAGTHPITLSYPGDTNNQSSTTSAALPQVVEDFSVAANAPSTSTIEPGTTATFTFTVSPVSPATTFPAAITLAAANLPMGATVNFSPAGIASGAGSTNVTMTVTTPSSTLARDLPPSGRAPAKWPLMALALLLLPLAGKFRRAGRRLSRKLSLLLLAAAGITAAAALNGCGGVASGYFGQSPATSSITVTGTSGSLNHSASVSLTVE
jgi:sugar lactone lactonase YvrE